MSEALALSNALLWLAVVVLGALVLALARQVGVLHERLAPAGALTGGESPAPGERAPVFELRDTEGALRKVGGVDPEGRGTLLLFVSPTCPVCREILPAARSLARRESVRLLFASDGDPAAHAPFVSAQGLGAEGYLLSGELGRAYGIGRLPHALLLDAEGVVRARGLVNTREHLESLVEAWERGRPSIQAWLADDDPGRRVA